MKKLTLILTIAILFLGLTSPLDVSAAIPGGEFESTMRLQNIGTAEASVSFVIYDASGTVAYTSSTITIAVDDIATIFIPSLSGLAEGDYSVVVSSSQPLASLSSFSDSDSGAAYTGFDQGDPSWFVPGLYDNYYSYYSSVTVQNTSASAVDITLEIFEENNSTPVYTNTKTNVASYASVTWDQEGLTELDTNSPYSGVVTATGDVVAIVNIYGSDDGPAGYDDTSQQLYSYNAYMDGGTLWYTPVVMNAYYSWNAAIVIQNVSSTLADVDVDYNTGDSKSYSIQPYSAVTIYVPNESGLPSGPDGLFSAEITSDVDVVVMVNESNEYNRAATYNGFDGGTTEVNAPEIMKRVSNFSTSVTCQNIGTTSTTMQIEYFGSTAGTTSDPVPSGGTWLWYQPNETLADGYDGSAVITSSGQPIACIINRNMEEEPYFDDMMDMLFSYNGVNK